MCYDLFETHSKYVLNDFLPGLCLSSTHTTLSMQAQTMQGSLLVGRSVTLWWSLMALWGRFCKLWRRRVWSTTLSSSSLVTTGRCFSLVHALCVSISRNIYMCAFAGQSSCGGLEGETQDWWNVAKARLMMEEWESRPSHIGLDPSNQVNSPVSESSYKKYTMFYEIEDMLFMISHHSKVWPVLWPALWTFCPPLPNWLELHYLTFN